MAQSGSLTVQQVIDLGLAHHRASRFAEAEALYRQVLAVEPNNPDGLFLLGTLAHQLGRHDLAVELIGRAIARNPQFPDYYNNYGMTLAALGRHPDAVAAYRQGLALRPNDANTIANLAAALVRLGAAGEAIDLCERARAAGTTSADLLNNLGIAYKEEMRTETAIACYRELIGQYPDHVEARENLANALRQQGRIDEALPYLEAALRMAPGAGRLWRNYLAALLYRAERDEASLFEAHRRFGRQFTRAGDALPVPLATDRDRERRLRIGIVSSDFWTHPVARAMRCWFTHRDRQAFELNCYAEVTRPDEETRWFQERADGWYPTVGLADDAVAAMIRRHRVDLLVIAAGHFDENRLTVAAWRAAPVQVTAYDGATSGLDAMDYALVDAVVSPPDGAERWTETRIYLPSFVTYEPPDDAPATGPAPLHATGRVTFGSFSNPSKITALTVAAWSEVLRRLPDARLILKCAHRYGDPAVRGRIEAMFVENGIDPARLDVRPRGNPRAEHLADYREIDIALDTFPFAGATTTFEALSMGVPVVTLAGAGLIGRISASMLHAVGLDDLATDSPATFVDTAVALARDPARVTALRAGLRSRLTASPLCDGPGQARAFYAALREAWRNLPDRPAT